MTKPCPCCGEELELPVKFFNAMGKMRKKIESYRDVILKEAEMHNPQPPQAQRQSVKTFKAQKYFRLLGFKAEDKITGMTGVIDSLAFDLYGCVQASLRPHIDKDGKLPDGHWFDVERLTLKSKEPVMAPPNFTFRSQAEGIQGPADKANRTDVIIP